MNIREYIKSNFKEDSIQSIRDSIVDSINKKEEVTLPGLGVFLKFYGMQVIKNIKSIF